MPSLLRLVLYALPLFGTSSLSNLRFRSPCIPSGSSSLILAISLWPQLAEQSSKHQRLLFTPSDWQFARLLTPPYSHHLHSGLQEQPLQATETLEWWVLIVALLLQLITRMWDIRKMRLIPLDRYLKTKTPIGSFSPSMRGFFGLFTLCAIVSDPYLHSLPRECALRDLSLFHIITYATPCDRACPFKAFSAISFGGSPLCLAIWGVLIREGFGPDR